MMGECARIKARFEDAKQEKEYDSLMSNWTPEEHKDFERLQKIFNVYREERMGEIDASGTIRSSLWVEEENSLNERFLTTLKQCLQDKIPNFSADQYQEVNKDLNALYKKVRNKYYPNGSGIDKEGIQKTQRAWLKYREAWVAFGRLKCPDMSPDSWKTLLTQERIKELQELAAIENYDEE